MTTTLYIDGLLGSVCDQELKDMFSRFGNVRSVDIMRLNTVPSLGVGTVQMESLEEAKEAVHALHRSYLGGQLLLVFHAPTHGSRIGTSVSTVNLPVLISGAESYRTDLVTEPK